MKAATGKEEGQKLAFTEPVAIERLSVGFPVYAVEYYHDNNILFVAGGGGPAKSGVRNSIMAFKYSPRTRMVRELCELSCGEEAPMCMTLHPTQPEYLAVGVNDRCWIVERDENERLNLAKSIRTDFSSLDSYQKTVRFSPDGHQLLTAGNDGHVRLWHFPWLDSTADVNIGELANNAKEAKIEDADYDKTGELIAVVTPTSIIIRCKKEDKVQATINAAHDFVFRCARFIRERKRSYLVTVENSKGRDRPILSIWKTENWTRYSSVKLYTRLRVTALAVSDNGRLIAIGAADGTVAVYDSRLYLYYYRRELHKFIVTSVAITEHKGVRLLITGSGDGGVRVVSIRKNRPWTWSGLFLLIFVMVTLFFFGLHWAGIIGDDEEL